MWGSKFCLLKERNGCFLCLCVHVARLCYRGSLGPHGGIFPFFCLEPLGTSSRPPHSPPAMVTSGFGAAGPRLTRKELRVCPRPACPVLEKYGSTGSRWVVHSVSTYVLATCLGLGAAVGTQDTQRNKTKFPALAGHTFEGSSSPQQ